MKEFNKLNEFKRLKFHSVIPQDILQAVSLLENLGYEARGDFCADELAKRNGLCAWDDGEVTKGWLDGDDFKQVTLEDLKEMVEAIKNNQLVLWLNRETMEECYLDKISVFPYRSSWVKVPEGATFATGDKDNFVFRKDGWYYDNQTGWWVKGDVNLQNFYKHEFVKLFWVKSDIKDSIFNIERLLGCEVLFNGRNLFVENIIDEHYVEVGDEIYQNRARVSDLTFFTEDGDELAFDEYVEMYYG